MNRYTVLTAAVAALGGLLFGLSTLESHTKSKRKKRHGFNRFTWFSPVEIIDTNQTEIGSIDPYHQ